jgi:hypothetical protein
MNLHRSLILIAGEPEAEQLTAHTPEARKTLAWLAQVARTQGTEDGRLIPIADDVIFYLTSRQCDAAIELGRQVRDRYQARYQARVS